MKNAADGEVFGQIKSLLFGIVGILIVAAAIVWGFSNQRFVNHAKTAKGTVIKLNAGGSHPEIRFATSAGNEIEYAQGGLISGYRVGDEVVVYYDSQNPRSCIINSFGALWGFPILALIVGICFICIALFLKFGAATSNR